MGYTARRGDPKFSSIQSFRTLDGIYVRIVSRTSHGWDPITNVTYKNSTLALHQRSLNVVNTSDSKIFLFVFDVEAALSLSRSVFDVVYYSNAEDTLVGYFNVSELALGISDLVFEDRFGEGASNNTYNYNSAIYHTSNSLKNTLRTFVYPLQISGTRSTLSPTNTSGQYYISNSSTALYVANSELQNAYYRSVTTATQGVDQSKFGYFVGGGNTQDMSFECSMGAKKDNNNLIKGHVHVVNLPEISVESPTYEVCTLRNSGNYYRTSPYPACDGTNLSLDIINDPNNIFIDGGCCDISTERTSFIVRHTVENPPANDLDGGSIMLNWSGGVAPYTVVFTCAEGDAGCAAVASGVNIHLASTTLTSYTITGLSGSSTLGDDYGYGVTDADSNIIGGEVYMNAYASRMIPTWCNVSGALNYLASSPDPGNTYVVIMNQTCRWCNSENGKITKGATDTDEGADNSSIDAYTLTIDAYEPATNTAEDVNIYIDLGVSNFIDQASSYFDGVGTETIRIVRRRLTHATYYDSSMLSEQKWTASAADSGNDETVSFSTDNFGTFQFLGTPPGYYIFKAYHVDSASTIITECYQYEEIAVAAYGCTDTAAINTSTGVSWIDDYVGGSSNTTTLVASDSTQCSYSTTEFSSAVADFNLEVSVQTDGNNVCSFGANLNYNGNEFNYFVLAIDLLNAISNATGISLGLLGMDSVEANLTYSTMQEGELVTGQFNSTYVPVIAAEFGETLLSFSNLADNVTTPIGVSGISIVFQVSVSGNTPIPVTLEWNDYSISLATVTSEGIYDNTSSLLCEGCFAAGTYVAGCTDPLSCNYNALATVNVGCVPANVIESGSNNSVTVDIDGTLTTGNPCGCTNQGTVLYDPVAHYLAVTYNNSVPYETNADCGGTIITGCTDSAYVEYNSAANVHAPAACITPIYTGCTDSGACNYNANAIQDDGSCYYTAQGCEDMQNWVISQFSPPNTCNENETQDGTISFTNTSYSGPLEFSGMSGIFNGLNFSYDAMTLSGVYSDGTFTFTPDPSMLANGVTVDAFQHPSLGTTITFTGVGSVVFNFFIHIPTDTINGYDLIYIESDCTCRYNTPDVSSFSNLSINESGGFVVTALGGTRANGDTGICGCMDDMSGTYTPSASVHTPALCEYYGCTDPEASNYLPAATMECQNPSSESYGGYPCSPCVYGVTDSLYNAAFCMPKNVTEQLEIIRKCIGTAGTASYINTITGKDDCTFKEAWKLILIEYLLAKKGLDCVYNCADGASPKLETLKTCKDNLRYPKDVFTGTLASGLTSTSGYRRFFLEDSVRMKVNRNAPEYYYTLKVLPEGLSKIEIHHSDYYESEEPFSNFAIHHSPLSPLGSRYWKLCEEPPSKPTSKDYLGKFITFVQNFCRQCQLPSSKQVTIVDKTPIDSVITVNGIILTINNSELK